MLILLLQLSYFSIFWKDFANIPKSTVTATYIVFQITFDCIEFLLQIGHFLKRETIV